jgi:hypothetical protein
VIDPLAAPQAADIVAAKNQQPDERADVTAPASRDRLELNGFIRVGGRPAWRPILPGRVQDGHLHRRILLAAALSGGVLIGAEVGRMTSRFGDSRVPKYGGFSAFTYKG